VLDPDTSAVGELCGRIEEELEELAGKVAKLAKPTAA
jgi:hypothetical protein